MHRPSRAFTILEILIVVVILGILAAVVVPQYLGASEDAAAKSTYHETQRLRKAVEVYLIRHDNVLPDVDAGNMTWNGLITAGDYLKTAPINQWVGGPNAGEIVIGYAPDNTFHTNYGWIYDDVSGQVWAAGYDSDDNPLPKP